MAEKLIKVFVYGTLRKGEVNCRYMQPAILVGKAKTCEKYPLIIASSLNCPYLLNQPGTGHKITGEVYEVTTEKLQELDEFENVPFVYDRCSQKVEIMDDDGMKCEENVNIYMVNGFKPELLEKQMFSDYSCASSSVKMEPQVIEMNKDQLVAVLREAVKRK